LLTISPVPSQLTSRNLMSVSRSSSDWMMDFRMSSRFTGVIVIAAMAREGEFGNDCFGNLRHHLRGECAGSSTVGILTECAIAAVISARNADAIDARAG